MDKVTWPGVVAKALDAVAENWGQALRIGLLVMIVGIAAAGVSGAVLWWAAYLH